MRRSLLGGQGSADGNAWKTVAIRLLLLGLAAMVRADFGYPPSEAALHLRKSARYLGLGHAGDPEVINLISWKWAATEAVPESAEQDRHQVNAQIAELVPGWFS